MAKKANPWVAALKKKKAPVDLHPDVLRAVLRMNPGMRGGDNSTEEVASQMMSDLPANEAPQTAFSDGKFKNVFSDMLEEFEGEFGKELKVLDDKRKAIDHEEHELRDGYIDRVVEFLAEVVPGPLNNSSREVILDHMEFFRKLKTETSDINKRVKDRSESYSK